MFDLKDGLEGVMDIASKFGGENLDLSKIITDKFVKDNTTLGTVKELLGKVGIDSLDDIQEKIPQLDSVLAKVSSFSSWKEFVAKAAATYLNK